MHPYFEFNSLRVFIQSRLTESATAHRLTRSVGSRASILLCILAQQEFWRKLERQSSASVLWSAKVHCALSGEQSKHRRIASVIVPSTSFPLIFNVEATKLGLPDVSISKISQVLSKIEFGCPRKVAGILQTLGILDFQIDLFMVFCT